KKYPFIRFDGVELTPTQLDFAKKKAQKTPNYYPVFGDYHNLSTYPDHSFEIVFVIEALCHSSDKLQVLKEVKRVLKRGGVFIIIDGYAKKDPVKRTVEENLASRLTE